MRPQTTGELYYCANCISTVELDVHGRCERCGSLAVYSEERIRAASKGEDNGKLQSDVHD